MLSTQTGEEAPLRSFTAGKLIVCVYKTRAALGRAAALTAAAKIRELLAMESREINMIFAAAPSQNEFLAELILQQDIDWTRVNAFHMDEYVGLGQSSPQSFASFLAKNIFDKVPFKQVHYIPGDSNDPAAEAERYTELLKQHPADIVCMGIGENTHIAFNDPFIADFKDPLMVKIVQLDEASRQQQVHDGCFPSIAGVPVAAITLTVPALLKARYVFCMVPGSNKAVAIAHTIQQEESEKYPSTVLRSHPDATLYLDVDSAGLL